MVGGSHGPDKRVAFQIFDISIRIRSNQDTDGRIKKRGFGCRNEQEPDMVAMIKSCSEANPV
jgi:hypothetical protein